MVDELPESSEVALIVGGGPGISASCARLFSQQGMKVAIAARTPEKPVLQKLTADYNVNCYACDAAEPESVTQLFRNVKEDLGPPHLVVHNIDGRVQAIFRKSITEASPEIVLETLRNSAYSAFLVGQQAAISMLANPVTKDGHRVFMSHMCRLTRLLVGRKQRVSAVTGWQVRRLMTIWLILLSSHKPTCSFTGSIDPPGPSKSCCGLGSKIGKPSG